MTALRFLTFTFWNYYVLKLLRFETIKFSDAMLSDINVVLCYVLSQYRLRYYSTFIILFGNAYIVPYVDSGMAATSTVLVRTVL